MSCTLDNVSPEVGVRLWILRSELKQPVTHTVDDGVVDG